MLQNRNTRLVHFLISFNVAESKYKTCPFFLSREEKSYGILSQSFYSTLLARRPFPQGNRFRTAHHEGLLLFYYGEKREEKSLISDPRQRGRTSFLSGEGQVLRSRSKSQWIAVWWLLYHSQHPGRYLSRLQTDWLTHGIASVSLARERDPNRDDKIVTEAEMSTNKGLGSD